MWQTVSIWKRYFFEKRFTSNPSNRKYGIFYRIVKMSYYDDNILEEDNEINTNIKVLDDSDVDDIEEELKQVDNVESEEYRW